MEFCSTEFNNYCKEEGIARQYTVRNTPQQNGVAERMNRTLLERARCLLSNAGLGRNFWAEAVNTACYLINRSPSTAIELKTPIQVWSDKPADYSILRIFGCNAYYHVNEGKLVPRSKKGLFMGYGDGVKGYRIWSPSEKKVILSRDVIFDESPMLQPKLEVSISRKEDKISKQVEDESIASKGEEEEMSDKDAQDMGDSEGISTDEIHHEDTIDQGHAVDVSTDLH